MDMRHSLGKLGEDFAASYLVSKGHKILKRNYSSRFGEIDIISLRNKELFFVEVKTRSSITMGYPSQAVDKRKLSHMEWTALNYLNKSNISYDAWSFKVIEVLINEIDELG